MILQETMTKNMVQYPAVDGEIRPLFIITTDVECSS